MTHDSKFNDPQWPSIPGKFQRTAGGTPYSTSPGVALICKPAVNITEVGNDFLRSFDEVVGFWDYLEDPLRLTPGDQLAKFAGQLCYMSFTENRTRNDQAEKYLENIKASGHGSVLEHANYSVLIYGADRSFTHELVRHRAGAAYSQVSQRYVDGQVLRFVEREEFQDDPILHCWFESRIDDAAEKYARIATRLMELQDGPGGILSAEVKRDLRKKVNQAARACLPNETEAAIVMTANARTWRHVFEMRASQHADVQIRRVEMLVFRCLKQVAPLIFGDYEEVELSDGTLALTTKHRKV